MRQENHNTFQWWKLIEINHFQGGEENEKNYNWRKKLRELEMV
jgi:hypothetical protein